MLEMVDREIEQAISSLLPHGAGPTTDTRLRHHMKHIATVAFNRGASYTLTSLMTVEEVAIRLNVSTRRVRAIARNRQERGFPVGWQVPGTSQWLFRPEDLDQLTPDTKYRRKISVIE